MEITSVHYKPIQRVVFMGTPLFATFSLQLLNEKGYRPVLVITQPDSPQGRKLQMTPSPIKTMALELGLDVIQPEQVNSEDTLQILRDLEPEIIVTVAYGGYIGKEIRALPKYGCINLHPSLLPKYRGPSPIHSALLNGETTTGNTIYRLTAKIDAGPIYLQETYPILPEQNLTLLEHDLAVSGAGLLIEVLQRISRNEICEQPQDHSQATYTKKIDSTIQKIDWNQTAERIQNQIRSLSFEPGVVATFREKPIKLLATQIVDRKSQMEPGQIEEIEKHSGILVATRDQLLRITMVQPAGKKMMDAYAFHIGARIEKGERFV
ncbi:MAG TPA: methionyl-tRNA formyltransferase [Candidatus Cloacimonadota bacterium]|nr:methionyl-tRNA formyltransferase [Candidatus Cloacimonadota bacterium]